MEAADTVRALRPDLLDNLVAELEDATLGQPSNHIHNAGAVFWGLGFRV